MYRSLSGLLPTLARRLIKIQGFLEKSVRSLDRLRRIPARFSIFQSEAPRFLLLLILELL
jgi:hypothetical protein